MRGNLIFAMFQLIRKESGEGIVCAVGKGRVFVAPLSAGGVGGLRQPRSSIPSKKGCGAPGGCGSCGGRLSAGGGDGKFFIGVDGGGNYVPGDRVRFCRFIPEPNLVSALVFGLPVAFVLTVMLFWLANAPDQLESALAAFSIVAAFFTAIFLIGILDRLFKIKYPPAIINTNNDACNINNNDNVNDDDYNDGTVAVNQSCNSGAAL